MITEPDRASRGKQWQSTPVVDSSAVAVTKLQINQVLRDRRPKSATPPLVEGLVNLYAATASPGARLIPFDAGINPLAPVATPDGPRRPAILISSSPHKSGSVVTPRQDIFAPDEGYVRYFGDAKTPGRAAHLAPGNALLISEFENHYAHPDEAQRARGVPLIFFKREPYAGKQKGYPRFQGLGIVTAARLVTQHDQASGGAFANYEFECAVLTMKHEGELFDWAWINARRNGNIGHGEALAEAPWAWKEWVKHGRPQSQGAEARTATHDCADRRADARGRFGGRGAPPEDLRPLRQEEGVLRVAGGRSRRATHRPVRR